MCCVCVSPFPHYAKGRGFTRRAVRSMSSYQTCLHLHKLSVRSESFSARTLQRLSHREEVLMSCNIARVSVRQPETSGTSHRRPVRSDSSQGSRLIRVVPPLDKPLEQARRTALAAIRASHVRAGLNAHPVSSISICRNPTSLN